MPAERRRGEFRYVIFEQTLPPRSSRSEGRRIVHVLDNRAEQMRTEDMKAAANEAAAEAAASPSAAAAASE